MQRRKTGTDKEKREALKAVVTQELANAEGNQTDALSANRESALQYYYGAKRGDEIEGRSQVISMDVADMVNATLAMIVPMLATDAVVEFEPTGEDDEQQAKAEGDVINGLVIEDNSGYIEIQEAIKDALLLKNGCLKISMQEQKDTETLDITGMDDEQLALFIMELAPNQMATREGSDLRVVTVRRRFVTGSVPIENISYQQGYLGDLQQIRFFAEMIPYTRSNLIRMGIDKTLVMSLAPNSGVPYGAESARQEGEVTNEDSYSPETEIIDCYECYQLIDLDGDGMAERYKVLMGGQDTVLEYEAADMIPYALGSPFLNPHRITGESLYDHIKATQDVKTSLKRQGLDNVAVINNGRYIYDPSNVTEADIMQPKAGGGIRARNPGQSVVPLMIPDVQSGIMAQIQYEDRVRSERGGASLDLMGAEPQLVGETAHGIERQYGSREALASMIARNLSEQMIKPFYLIVHEYLRRWANEPFQVRIAGSYQEINASDWPVRKRVNVKTGMSPGERGHLQQALLMHLNLSAQAMQSGLDGIMVSADTIYRTSQDWLRLAGVDNPERMAIDPSSQGAQQAAQAKQQQGQQQMQAQNAKERALLMEHRDLESAKIAEDARQADMTNAYNYYKTDQESAVAEAKMAGEGTIQLERERIVQNGKQQ